MSGIQNVWTLKNYLDIINAESYKYLGITKHKDGEL